MDTTAGARKAKAKANERTVSKSRLRRSQRRLHQWERQPVKSQEPPRAPTLETVPSSIDEDETGYILAAIRHREPFRHSKDLYVAHEVVDKCAAEHVCSPRDPSNQAGISIWYRRCGHKLKHCGEQPVFRPHGWNRHEHRSSLGINCLEQRQGGTIHCRFDSRMFVRTRTFRSHLIIQSDGEPAKGAWWKNPPSSSNNHSDTDTRATDEQNGWYKPYATKSKPTRSKSRTMESLSKSVVLWSHGDHDTQHGNTLDSTNVKI